MPQRPKTDKSKPQKPFWRSAEYRKQLDPKNPQRIRGSALESLKKFLTAKRHDPIQPYGSSDYPFIAAGPIGRAIPGLMHAHLSQDLSVVYKVEGNEMFLYGIYSHADLGTGTPPNLRRQQSVSQRLSNMTFTEE